MKEISIDAGLRIVYTNHSIRATCITLLDNAGNEARHIMAVSGHKSESSIRSYSKTGFGAKRKMSSLLSSTMTSVSEAKAVDLDIDDRSFLDSFEFSSSPIDCDSCLSSSTGSSNPKYQKALREVSNIKNFNFNIDFDIEDVDEPTNQNSLQAPTTAPTHQVKNVQNNIKANKFFSMFGSHPTFNTCTFNIN